MFCENFKAEICVILLEEQVKNKPKAEIFERIKF